MGQAVVRHEGASTRSSPLRRERKISLTKITKTALEEIRTCTNPNCWVEGGFTGPGPTNFGFRTVPAPGGGTKQVFQPWCRPCRAVSAKIARQKKRAKERRAAASRRGWETRRAKGAQKGQLKIVK